MTSLQVLKKARKLLANPAKWTQGNYAKDKYGKRADYDAKNATQFCAMGACMRVSKNSEDADYAIRELREVLTDKFSYVDEFNDSPRRTQVQVLRLFDKAIAHLEKTK